jgi:hypothetical protein
MVSLQATRSAAVVVAENLVQVAGQFCAVQKWMLKSSNAVKVVSAMVVRLADTKCVYKFVTESPR